MKRKDFLKSAGLLSLGSLLDFQKMLGAVPASAAPDGQFPDAMVCTVTPSETAGPYPWASGTNVQSSVFWRSDIREPGTAGSGAGCIPLTVKLRIINVANCAPIANARVDLWHCNETGGYSGYSPYVGQTFLRGIQHTDSEGYVTFKTIFPSWYSGRINHVHFQVFVAGVSKLISQFTFTQALIDQIHGLSPYTVTPGKPPYGPPAAGYPGASGYTHASDNIFNNGTAGQILNVTGDVNTGLTGTLDVVVNYATGAAGANIGNFNGGIQNGKVTLWWAAETTADFSHFEIEKSHDFEDFESIARIEGKAGENGHYLFTEPGSLSQDAQYRLKMVGKDGSADLTIYLPMKPANASLKLKKNRVRQRLVLAHPPAKSGETVLTVLDVQGRELLRGTVKHGASASSLELNSIASGSYLLVYDDASSLQVLPFSKK